MMSDHEETAEPTEMTISALRRYPVKGLMGEELTKVTVKVDHCFPFDRAYAIENGNTRFDPADPKFLPKINFLMLMRDERLALLTTSFDEATQTLTISRRGRPIASGDLSTAIGRNLIEQFIGAFMEKELKGPPRIQSAAGHNFTDTPDKYVHIINMTSVKALGHLVNTELNPARFRANIHLEGAEAWAERHWCGKRLLAGEVEIEICEETNRCAAINVDPETASRTHSLPRVLNQHFGNDNFGIYGRIIKGGTLEKGAKMNLER